MVLVRTSFFFFVFMLGFLLSFFVFSVVCFFCVASCLTEMNGKDEDIVSRDD